MDTNLYVGYFENVGKSIRYLKQIKNICLVNLSDNFKNIDKINTCIIELDVISKDELSLITNLSKQINIIVLKDSKSSLIKEQIVRQSIMRSNNHFLLVCNLQERDGRYNYKYISDLIDFCKNKDMKTYNKYFDNVEKLKQQFKDNLLTNDNEIDFANKIYQLIREKDEYTAGHCLRVSNYSVMIAKELKLSEKEIFNIKIAGIIHDFGKILVPDNILKSKSNLSNSQYSIIQQHTILGYDVLKQILTNGLDYILKCAEEHHERIDGRGYPEGLKSDQILEGAKIIAVADCYDAMTTTRSYNVGHEKTTKQAIEILKKCENTQLSKREVETFIRIIERKTINEK